MTRISAITFTAVFLLAALWVSPAMAVGPDRELPDFLEAPGGPAFSGSPPPRRQAPDSQKDAPVSETAKLAAKPYRPSWAPVPVFRGEEMAQRFIPALLKAPKPADRARAAFLLGQIGSRAWASAIARLLKDPDSDVRTHASIALASLGDPRGLSGSVQALGSAAPWVQDYAVWGLWNINSKAAKDAIRVLVPRMPKWVADVAKRALVTPYVRPPAVSPLKATKLKLPKVPPSEIWGQAESLLVDESDWWWHKGAWDQCIRCCYASIFLNPNNDESYSVIAYLDWSSGRMAQADRVLKQGVANAPKNPFVYFNLGLHYYTTKRYLLAEWPLKQSVELNGDHRARRTYAHCLEKLGKLKEALGQWDALRKIRPKDTSVTTNYERVRKMVEGK